MRSEPLTTVGKKNQNNNNPNRVTLYDKVEIVANIHECMGGRKPPVHPLPSFLSSNDEYRLPDLSKTQFGHSHKNMANRSLLHDSKGDEFGPIIKIDGKTHTYHFSGKKPSIKCDDYTPGKQLSISFDNGAFSSTVSINTLRHGSRRVARLAQMPLFARGESSVGIAEPNNVTFNGPPATDSILPPGALLIHRPEVVWKFSRLADYKVLFRNMRQHQINYFRKISNISRPDTSGLCASQLAIAMEGYHRRVNDNLKVVEEDTLGFLGLLINDSVKRKEISDLVDELVKEPFFGLPKPLSLSPEYEMVMKEFYSNLTRIAWAFQWGGRRSRLDWFAPILDCRRSPIASDLKSWGLKWWTECYNNQRNNVFQNLALYRVFDNEPRHSKLFERARDACDRNDEEECLNIVFEWLAIVPDILNISFVDLIGNGNDSAIQTTVTGIDAALFIRTSEKYIRPAMEIARYKLGEIPDLLLCPATTEIVYDEVVCDRIRRKCHWMNENQLPEVEFTLKANGSTIASSQVGFTSPVHERLDRFNSNTIENCLELRLRDCSRRPDSSEMPMFNPYECFVTLPGFMRLDARRLEHSDGTCKPLGFLDDEGHQLIHVCFTERDGADYVVRIPIRYTKENNGEDSTSRFTFCFRTMYNDSDFWMKFAHDRINAPINEPDGLRGEIEDWHHEEYRQREFREICPVAWWCERLVTVNFTD